MLLSASKAARLPPAQTCLEIQSLVYCSYRGHSSITENTVWAWQQESRGYNAACQSCALAIRNLSLSIALQGNVTNIDDILTDAFAGPLQLGIYSLGNFFINFWLGLCVLLGLAGRRPPLTDCSADNLFNPSIPSFGKSSSSSGRLLSCSCL